MGIRKALSLLKNAVSGVPRGPDGFPLDPASPLYACHCLISQFLTEVPDFTRDFEINTSYPSGERMLNAPEEEKIALIEAMTERRAWVHYHDPGSFKTSYGILHTLTKLLRRRQLPYTAAQAAALVSVLSAQMASTHCFDDDLGSVIKICERLRAQGVLDPKLQEALLRLKASLNPRSRWESAARKRFRDNIELLTAPSLPPPIDAGEAWSNAALQELEQMAPATRDGWLSLLQHCGKADGSKPTQKWSRTAQELAEVIGRDDFKTRAVRWFELVALPRPAHRDARSRWQPDPDLLLSERNASILKGMVWACAGWVNKDVTRAVSALAQACFKKVPNLGARCPRVGNACLYSLSLTLSDEAAAELTRLNQVVKQPSARQLVDKSLNKAAELSGRTREDLEEATVPTYGLDAQGCLKQELGEFTAEYCLTGPYASELRWRKTDGKVQQSVPAEVKDKHAAELKALKRNIQDIEKMLPAHRQRLERLLLAEREWEFETWRERYLVHPLLANLSRRLIWHFTQNQQQAAGIWLNGKLVDHQDRALDWVSPGATVRLWHPLGQPIETVAHWRRWFDAHEVTQPFKQAHREIYILTDAELQTATYSNRFAAHIIRQHQFAALAKERGWTYRLQGDFDSQNSPTLLLPRWDLAAEFWVESVPGSLGSSETGIHLHLSTDQVRFCDLTGTPRPLSEVPALVFSEVMRDVDLFVGVCSIGNDPAWQDQGEAIHGGYWYRYSFGDLSATARTRGEVLERLLPRLKIANQCELKEKFLVVRGSLRTYKIHLGSSNILMEPNDRYLCIVPDRSRRDSPGGDVFLPFEGDHTLAVILSKAFLLANDSQIKEPSIVHQIQGLG